MLKKRIISSSIAMALTASVAMLSGCPSPTTNPSPKASPSSTESPTGTASPTASPSSTESPTGTASPIASPSSTGSPTGTPTPSVVAPTSPTGTTPDIASKTTVDGKVFDKKGFPVDGATVTLTLLDPGVKFDDGSTSLSTKTVQGSYVFRSVPVGTRIEIKASKEGWTTKTRVESVKSNLQGDTNVNKFNFGSEGTTSSSSSPYALQDEPQVELVKVNGIALDKFGSTYTNTNDRPTESTSAAVVNLKPELTFELMFTEPVKQSSVQNAFKVDSEELTSRLPVGCSKFTLTESAFNWTWSSDNKSVTIKSKKPLLQQKSGNQMRYKVYFDKAFEDTQGVSAEKNSYFKFGTNVEKDYFTIALENDTADPRLLGAEYNDTGTAEYITLTFSEPFEVYAYRANGVLTIGSYTIMRKVGTTLQPVTLNTSSVEPELSSDGKLLRIKINRSNNGGNRTFVKDDVVSVEVGTSLKDPAGRSFSTSDTGKVEDIDTSDNKKVFKVIN